MAGYEKNNSHKERLIVKKIVILSDLFNQRGYFMR